MPVTERNPVAEQAVKKLANVAENRVIFLIGHSSAEFATQAARDFSSSLAKYPVFKNIIADIPAFDPKQMTEIYLQHRFGLLSVQDRDLLASGKVNDGLVTNMRLVMGVMAEFVRLAQSEFITPTTTTPQDQFPPAQPA